MGTPSKKTTAAARAKAEEAGIKLTTYQVVRNLQHDGTDYIPDGKEVLTIDLDDDQAKQLLAAGVIQAMPAEA